MARKAKVKTLTVDGSAFRIRTSWGMRKDLVRQRREIVEAEKKRDPDWDENDDDAPISGEYEQAMMDFTDSVLHNTVLEYQDADGEWHKFSEEDELDGDEASKLVAAAAGEIEEGVEVEGATPLVTSTSSPPTTPEGA